MQSTWQQLHPEDSLYPPLLGQIHDPPQPLYIRGEIDNLEHALLIAVVGSRKATAYGKEVVRRIIEPLAEAGVIIVSGLAFGIDGEAHEAALRAKGRTIAVIGTPINKIYPSTHENLAQRILSSGGAILSESGPNDPTFRSSFARRNRIIAGLCQGTVVIEAAEKSGSLITADCAAEENREVFAVPGPITSATSAGTNRLMKFGAHPLTSADDLLQMFEHTATVRQLSLIKQTFSPEEEQIIGVLEIGQPVHIDFLARSVTINLPVLQSKLTVLELNGAIKMVSPGWYIRT